LLLSLVNLPSFFPVSAKSSILKYEEGKIISDVSFTPMYLTFKVDYPNETKREIFKFGLVYANNTKIWEDELGNVFLSLSYNICSYSARANFTLMINVMRCFYGYTRVNTSLRISSNFSISDVRLAYCLDLKFDRFIVPGIIDIYRPQVNQTVKRARSLLTGVSAVPSDNYILLCNSKEGYFYLIALDQPVMQVTVRVIDDFWHLPIVWFNLDERLRHGTYRFCFAVVPFPQSISPSSLMVVASDLAHEFLVDANVTIKVTRQYDYWQYEVTYHFYALPNKFGLNPFELSPHNSDLELVNDTCFATIYLPKFAQPYLGSENSPCIFISTGEFAIGLYFKDSAAGSRGNEDLWLGNSSSGGGFYIKKNTAGEYVVRVYYTIPAEKMIPSMYISKPVLIISKEYFNVALVMTIVNIILLALVLILLLMNKNLIITKMRTNVDLLASNIFWLIVSSLFYWAFSYNILKLHFLAIGNMFLTVSVLSVSLYGSEKRTNLFSRIVITSVLLLATYFWAFFMPENCLYYLLIFGTTIAIWRESLPTKLRLSILSSSIGTYILATLNPSLTQLGWSMLISIAILIFVLSYAGLSECSNVHA